MELSETRKPGSGEIRSIGCTYYWSGMSKSAHLKGIAIGISSRPRLSVVEVTPVDEHIMCLRLKHTLVFMSCCSVHYAMLHNAKLDSVLDQCPRQDTLIVLADFNAITGIERAGYELCVGPHGSGTKNTNSSSSSEFCKIQKVENCNFFVSDTKTGLGIVILEG